MSAASLIVFLPNSVTKPSKIVRNKHGNSHLTIISTETKDLDFDMLKKFILEKTETAKRSVVYNSESAIEGISVNPTAQQSRLNPQLVRLRHRLLNLVLLRPLQPQFLV
jgi:hypothetical protein